MSCGRSLAAAAALVCAAAAAGCGLGAGSSSPGTATLTVTTDYGSVRVAQASEEGSAASETVIRFLDREADITTRYGGGFVQSINGIDGAQRSGRRYDWFFYVNGIESSVGSAEVPVHGGDRIWWDYRDWTNALRVPAVVGSWPQPFAQASAGTHGQARVECLGGGAACGLAARRLDAVGVTAHVGRGGGRSDFRAMPRMLIGPWSEVGRASGVDELRGGPGANGVFAAFKGTIRGQYHLIALDSAAAPVRDLGPDAGLIAALKNDDGPPAWIVTGSTPGAVEEAAGRLDAATLRDRYAVAVDRDRPVALPVSAGRPG